MNEVHELQMPDLAALQRRQLCAQLLATNDLSARYGLSLSPQSAAELVENRLNALRDTGRIEFAEGILSKLIYHFCDSAYITQNNYSHTLSELQGVFYYFKNESMDRIDDDLIALMRRHFDTTCQGSLEHLAGTALEELCRSARSGGGALL